MFKISTAVAGRFFFQWGQSLLYSVQCTHTLERLTVYRVRVELAATAISPHDSKDMNKM